MKVLVTGATGFTGSHLARTLARSGDSVAALVRPRSVDRAAPLKEERIDVRVGDLSDAASVQRAAAGCELVYHIAATYREPGQSNSAYRRVNVEGTRHVLEAARAVGVRRVVHCSTSPRNTDARAGSMSWSPGRSASTVLATRAS